MSDHRGTKPATRQFTLEQLRGEHSRVASAAKKDGGCIVVDQKGQRIFSLWIPQEPLGSSD